jgi:hypothetical protein
VEGEAPAGGAAGGTGAVGAFGELGGCAGGGIGLGSGAGCCARSAGGMNRIEASAAEMKIAFAADDIKLFFAMLDFSR